MICPWCNKELGAIAQYYNTEKNTLVRVDLKDGDKAVCTTCAQVTVMDKGKLRRMTMDEEIALPDEEREKLSWSQLVVVQTRRKKDGLEEGKGDSIGP